MITNSGKMAIGNMFSDLFNGSIGVGISAAAAVAADNKLGFEIYRTPVTVVSYDNLANLIVVKGVLPNHIDMKIYETGLFSLTDSGSRSSLVSSFEAIEIWAGGVWQSTNHRVGSQNLRVTTNAIMDAASINLGEFSPGDTIEFAATGVDGTVHVDFMTDTDNYYRATFTVLSGFRVYRINISSLTSVGSPSQIIEQVGVTYTGTNQIDCEALRIHRNSDAEGILITRRVLATPQTKTLGRTTDIEIPVSLVLA